MDLKSVWPYSTQNKRKHISFMIPNCDGFEQCMNPHVKVQYWTVNKDIVGIASSQTPLRYSRWKHLIPNATFYTDKCKVPEVTYTETPPWVADKENIDVRLFFDSIFTTD